MGVQASSGMASMARRMEGVWRTVMLRADALSAAHGHHSVAVEAGIGTDRELPAGAGVAHPADGLAQEVGRPSGGVGAARTQASHQHVTGPGGDGEQRVIAPDVAVAEVRTTLLLQAVGLADGRVEVDRERRRAWSGAGRPGTPEELPAHPVELTHMAPA